MNIKKFDSINVIPFIDIVLVLLVIVLTTATFVAKGMIPIDLSKTKSSTKLKKEDSLIITIKENNQIFFDKKNITQNEVLFNLKKYKTNTPIKINCDKNLKFEHFIFILNILKKNNYTNLAIVTKYE